MSIRPITVAARTMTASISPERTAKAISTPPTVKELSNAQLGTASDFSSRKPLPIRTDSIPTNFSEESLVALERANETLSQIRTTATRVVEATRAEIEATGTIIETLKSDISNAYALYKKAYMGDIKFEDTFASPFTPGATAKELKMQTTSRVDAHTLTWKENINGEWVKQKVSFAPYGILIDKAYAIGDKIEKCQIGKPKLQDKISIVTQTGNESKKIVWIDDKISCICTEEKAADGIFETSTHIDEKGQVYEHRKSHIDLSNIEASEVFWLDADKPISYNSTLRNKSVRGKFSTLADVRFNGNKVSVKNNAYKDPLNPRTLFATEECNFNNDVCEQVTIRNNA